MFGRTYTKLLMEVIMINHRLYYLGKVKYVKIIYFTLMNV